MQLAAPPSARMSDEDADDLRWYFGHTTHDRSPVGAQIERAKLIAYGSDGKMHKPFDPWIHDNEGRVIGTREMVPCKETQTEAGGYEIDDVSTLRYVAVAARLAEVERLSPQAYRVLVHYYGQGDRWAEQEQGRTWSIVALTHIGHRWLRALATERERKNQPASPLQPAEQLANEHATQKLQPDEMRGAKLRLLIAAAETLLRDAHTVWNRAR